MRARSITKDTLIGEAVALNPKVAEVLTTHGLHCIGCHVNPYESIEQGALAHGMSREEVGRMVKEANDVIRNGSSGGDGVSGETPVHAHAHEVEGESDDISLSEHAGKKIKELMRGEGKEGSSLRVGVETGGCSGYSYVLEFEKEAKSTDAVLESQGIQVLVDKEYLGMLQGLRIDYTDGLSGSGFKITNPNASSTCGCGKSFG